MGKRLIFSFTVFTHYNSTLLLIHIHPTSTTVLPHLHPIHFHSTPPHSHIHSTPMPSTHNLHDSHSHGLHPASITLFFYIHLHPSSPPQHINPLLICPIDVWCRFIWGGARIFQRFCQNLSDYSHVFARCWEPTTLYAYAQLSPLLHQTSSTLLLTFNPSTSAIPHSHIHSTAIPSTPNLNHTSTPHPQHPTPR